jgi:hypothetical protein
MVQKAFFAYPAGSRSISDAIGAAVAELKTANELIITPWESLSIVGLKLDRLIREKISDADFLIADITFPNFNVYYEIGYAFGVFDHTIAAFWQYIVYAEILLKLREALLPKAKYNLTLLTKIRELEEKYGLTEEMVAGDFTARLALAVRLVVDGLSNVKGKDARSYLTNLLFESHIPALRDTIVELGSEFKKIVLLFDNIDKGWPARRVEPMIAP